MLRCMADWIRSYFTPDELIYGVLRWHPGITGTDLRGYLSGMGYRFGRGRFYARMSRLQRAGRCRRASKLVVIGNETVLVTRFWAEGPWEKMTPTQRTQFNRILATLKRIADDYQTPEELRENSEDQYGLDYAEAIEMAYENIQQEARSAIEGVCSLHD